MFRNTYQSGLLSILYSVGSKPLQLWEPTSEKWVFEIWNSAVCVHGEFSSVLSKRVGEETRLYMWVTSEGFPL